MGVSTLRPLRAILLKIGMFFPPEAFTLGVPRLMEVERSSVAPLRKRDIDKDVGKKCESIFFIIVHENDDNFCNLYENNLNIFVPFLLWINN